MILPIITVENPLLRKQSVEVSDTHDQDIQILIDDLIETMYEKDGIGLAAPQVGSLVRITVIVPDPEHYELFQKNRSEALVIINPRVSRSSLFSDVDDEGCLSVPGYLGSVRRKKGVTVEFLDRTGKQKKMKMTSLLARAIQHEIDHLDGILYIDKATKLYKLPHM